MFDRLPVGCCCLGRALCAKWRALRCTEACAAGSGAVHADGPGAGEDLGNAGGSLLRASLVAQQGSQGCRCVGECGSGVRRRAVQVEAGDAAAAGQELAAQLLCQLVLLGVAVLQGGNGRWQ